MKTVKLASARHAHLIPAAPDTQVKVLPSTEQKRHYTFKDFTVVRYYDDLPTSGSDSGRAFRDLEWEAWPVALKHLEAKRPVEIEWKSNLGRSH